MPDISMCQDHACPSREKCYRYTAKPNGNRQAYGMFERPEHRKRCDYYMPIRSQPTAAEIDQYNRSKPWQ